METAVVKEDLEEAVVYYGAALRHGAASARPPAFY